MSNNASSTSSSTHETLWKLIKDIRFGMLSHRGASGELHSHPLTTQNKDLDEQAQLYFFVPNDGELAQRLRAENRVNLSYADPGGDSYVSISGTAGFIDDLQKKKELWSPMAKSWFPNGVEDPNLALLAVRINHAEYWDIEDSKLTQLFKMARSAITGNPPSDLGEHKELKLS